MNTKFSFQIDIPRRAANCAQGLENFQPGMEFYSVLLDGVEKGVFQRIDYCAACWSQLDVQVQHPKLISYWKSRVPAKKISDDLPKQRDARVLALLKAAVHHGQTGHDEAFVLALYLARKRQIILRQEMKLPEGGAASLYEVVETEEMLCVPRVALSGLQVAKIQQSLASQLAGS